MMGSIKNLSIENLIKNLTKILIDKGYINSELWSILEILWTSF